MPEPEDNIESLATGTQLESQETQPRTMVPVETQTQVQGETDGNKKGEGMEKEKVERKEMASMHLHQTISVLCIFVLALVVENLN
jgi:hypothetical protein